VRGEGCLRGGSAVGSSGLTTILDMTAEDILRKNPRYLTRAKSFDTFFTFGPQLLTPDEVGEIGDLTVATVLNGEKSRRERRLQHDVLAVNSKGITLLPQELYELTTPRRSASPPRWVRSRRSSGGGLAGRALVSCSLDCMQVRDFSENRW
jgi:fumarylacetoacetase-like protein